MPFLMLIDIDFDSNSLVDSSNHREHLDRSRKTLLFNTAETVAIAACAFPENRLWEPGGKGDPQPESPATGSTLFGPTTQPAWSIAAQAASNACALARSKVENSLATCSIVTLRSGCLISV